MRGRKSYVTLEERVAGKLPCAHSIVGMKVRAPDICPWCKVEVLQARIFELEEKKTDREEQLESVIKCVDITMNTETQDSFERGYEWGWVDGRSRGSK